MLTEPAEFRGELAHLADAADALGPAGRPTMRFDTESRVVTDPLAERRRLWVGPAGA